MTTRNPTLLSDVIATAGSLMSRRRFMTSIPVATLTAAACVDQPAQRTGAQDATLPDQRGPINSSSRLDTALVQGGDHPDIVAPALSTAAAAPFRRYDPALPPLSAERRIQVHWRSREIPLLIRPDLAMAAWTFEGDVPGPVLHVRQGDTIDFTLTNEGDFPHSMDFHAAQLNPRTAFRSVLKGESVSYRFQPKHAGAFLYHCGTAPVLMHIGAGMYGAIVVDPLEPLPPAREFVLVQSEYYLSAAQSGLAGFDYRKAVETIPDYVVFNGRPDQYIIEPIRVQRGERVRFYVVSAGPTHCSNFHVVGEQFDVVYLGAPPANPLRGVQTFAVPPGGGMVFDLVADIPGEFPFVDHGFGHGQKGAIGILSVEE